MSGNVADADLLDVGRLGQAGDKCGQCQPLVRRQFEGCSSISSQMALAIPCGSRPDGGNKSMTRRCTP